jgi:hypothetical protein
MHRPLSKIRSRSINPAHELAGMARWLARKAIKEQLRRANVHMLDVEPSDIIRAADDLLKSNGPELIERAKLWLKMRGGAC